MSAEDESGNKDQPSQADRTLLGVAPPKLDSSSDAGPRSPVFVRAGTGTGGGEEPLPLPRMALPSRPPQPLASAPLSEAPSALSAAVDASSPRARQKLQRLARAQPWLWMVAAPALVASLVIAIAVATAPAPQPAPSPAAAGVVARSPAAVTNAPPSDATSPGQASLGDWTALEGKAADSLTAAEWIRLANGRAERERASARALREKLADNPALGRDKAMQAQLLQLAGDTESSREALLAMTLLEAPLGADLLYEAWTGTNARTDATELARALVYSADVRPKASKALAVALDLRIAETCPQNREILSRALTDGDKRSLHLLVKLQNRRGCGPKKAQDCFACLRENKDELTATINAVRSRRAPSYGAP